VLQRNIAIPFPFVQNAVSHSGVTGADSFESFREKFRGESEGLFENVYASWSAEAARLQIPLTVVVLPRADSKGKSPRVYQMIRSLSSQNGLDFLDLSNALDHLDVEDFRISDWDKHPNALGHRVIFEALRDVILKRGQIPGLSLSHAK
jgi:hypothetical protein